MRATRASMLERDAQDRATLGGLVLSDLVTLHDDAEPSPTKVKTPAYVYDLDAMAQAAKDLARGFEGQKHLIAYAVKANTAGPIIRTLKNAGCGAEVVSGGELRVAQAVGISPSSILFSGVAKTNAEIDLAINAGDQGILAIQMESVEEIRRVQARAKAQNRKARVSLRINPDVVADTHAHVATGHDEAKFGIAIGDLSAAFEALDQAKDTLHLVGIGCHIGSQLTRIDEYIAAAEIIVSLAQKHIATRHPLELLDLGGGFGIDYGSGCPAKPADFAQAITRLVQNASLEHLRIVVEPGRCLVAPFGVLIASVITAKRSRGGGTNRQWLMIDAGMNDLIRPALYTAKHRIEPLNTRPSPNATPHRVVGPVCESSDDFGEHPFDTPEPKAVLIRDTGAYGFTMASEYNGRPLPTEIFLSQNKILTTHTNRPIEDWVKSRAF